MNHPSMAKADSQGGASALAKGLIKLGYRGLFQGMDEGAMDAIWNESGAPEALTRLVVDPEAPALARFLAAELLFCRQEGYPPDDHKRQLASLYGAALAGDFTVVANTWGWPGIVSGLSADHFEALGAAAIPELVSLLDNDKRVYYVGSQEATLGEIYGYRVKDLAAYYLSRITGMPLELNEDSRQRDKEIEKLKQAL